MIKFKTFLESKDEYYFTAMADRAMESAMDNTMKEKPVEKDAISDWFVEVLEELKSKIDEIGKRKDNKDFWIAAYGNRIDRNLNLNKKEEDYIYFLREFEHSLRLRNHELTDFVSYINSIINNNILPVLKEINFYKLKSKIEKEWEKIEFTNSTDSQKLTKLDKFLSLLTAKIHAYFFSSGFSGSIPWYYVIADLRSSMSNIQETSQDIKKAINNELNQQKDKKFSFSNYKLMEDFLDKIWQKMIAKLIQVFK